MFTEMHDFDNDSDLDVITSGSSCVLLLENEGSGEFTQKTLIHTYHHGAWDMDIIDLNQDGKLDVLLTSEHQKLTTWYKNLGLNEFQLIHLDTSIKATAIESIDLDGDTDIDVLITSESSNKAYWLENDGFQNFTKHTFSATVMGPTDIISVDFNGDLHNDVLIGSSSNNQILLLQNDGMLDFSEHVITSLATGNKTIQCADLDQDGDMDVLSANSGSTPGNYEGAYWYENTGTYPFTPHNISATGSGALLYTNAITCFDADADGDLDVASSGDLPYRSVIYINDGSENFTEIILSSEDQHVNTICAGDLTGSGANDLLYTSSIDNAIGFYSNDGTGSFTREDPICTEGPLAVMDSKAGDVDSDGDLDLISINSYLLNPMLHWYENKGNQQFIQHKIAIPQGPIKCEIGDLNSDGHTDIVIADFSFNTSYRFYKNDGSQNFTSQSIASSSSLCNKMELVDIDGDSDLDLLAAESTGSSGKMTLYIQGTTGFTPMNAATFALDLSDFKVKDMDNDGDLDIITASGNNQVSWLENNALTFTTHVLSSSFLQVSTLDVEDVDSDGDLDVIASSQSTGDIKWFKNNGGLTFSETLLGNSVGIKKLHLVDIDGDLDVDIVYNQLGTYYLENDGSMNFTQFSISNDLTAAQSLQIVDLDGDLDFDCLTSSLGDDRISWLENPSKQEPVSDANAPALTQTTIIYPNPSKGQFSIQSLEKFNGYSIYNHLGQIVQQITHRPTNFLKMTNFKTGIYFIVLREDNSILSSSRFIIK